MLKDMQSIHAPGKTTKNSDLLAGEGKKNTGLSGLGEADASKYSKHRFGGQDGMDRPSGRSSDDEPTFPDQMDIEYYSDQINKILESIDEFHQDLGTEVEMKGEETGNYEYDTMEKQLSRYINGAQKQLESLQKYLERQKGKGL